MAKATKKKVEEVSLETVLWNCRVALRGVGSTDKNRDAVISLCFLKFAGDKFERRRAELIAQYGDIPAFLEKVSFYNAVNVFYLKETARWSYIVKNAGANDIAVILDQAMADIEAANPSLKGALSLNLYATLGAPKEKIKQLIDEVNKIDESRFQEEDLIGRVYEYFLQVYAASGTKEDGEFYTPACIVQLIAELIEPYSGVVYDPACGTGGFLVSAGEYLKENRREEIFFDRQKKDHYMNHMFHGYDMDRTMLRIGAMNMMTHGIDNPYIEYRDSLSDQNTDREKYSLILANPPFKGSLDADIVSADLLKVCKTKKTELLFLALFLRMLKVGGRCACIVPDGVLFGSSTAHKAIRKEIVEGNRLEAVISMPSGVFKPYAGVSTAVLVFTKTGHGGTDDVWFYDMKADGFSLDDKRTEMKENDIPDIVKRFHDRKEEKDRQRTEQSFLVPKEEIAQNGYDLSINKYKQVEYVPVEYPSTQEILANLHELEMEITKGLAELEGMV